MSDEIIRELRNDFTLVAERCPNYIKGDFLYSFQLGSAPAEDGLITIILCREALAYAKAAGDRIEEYPDVLLSQARLLVARPETHPLYLMIWKAVGVASAGVERFPSTDHQRVRVDRHARKLIEYARATPQLHTL